MADIDLDDDLVAEVEALASVRTRDLVLPPKLLNFYGSTTYRARSSAMIDLDIGILALNLIGMGFDWFTLAGYVEGPLAASRLVVILAFLGGIFGLRSSWGCGREGVLVIAPVATMIFLAGACGLYAGPGRSNG